jgi:hypothetical protein
MRSREARDYLMKLPALEWLNFRKNSYSKKLIFLNGLNLQDCKFQLINNTNVDFQSESFENQHF